MAWAALHLPGGADRQLAAGPTARLRLEHQGVVSGAGARGARQQPAVGLARAHSGPALARLGREAPPRLASLAMLVLLVNNAWEGNLKGRLFNPPPRSGSIVSWPRRRLYRQDLGRWYPAAILPLDRSPAGLRLFVLLPTSTRPTMCASGCWLTSSANNPNSSSPNRSGWHRSSRLDLPSHLAFYQYLAGQYEEVDPGLYRRR